MILISFDRYYHAIEWSSATVEGSSLRIIAQRAYLKQKVLIKKSKSASKSHELVRKYVQIVNNNV
jgi:hypothetical protein